MLQRLKDFFIPHKGNTYTPNSLEIAAVKGMALMVLLSFAITNFQSVIWPTSQWLVSTILPAVIVELTNEERTDGQLGNLRRNSTLDAAATLKAQHMAANQYFSHNSPDGTTPWYWFGQAGYVFVHAGENLAIHFTDSGDVVQAWMDSPTHRANIMNGNYTEIGVGTAEGVYEGFRTVYVVQLFGTPAANVAVAGESIAITPEVTPESVAPVQIEEPAEVLAAELAIATPEPVLEPDIAQIVADSDSVAIISDFVSTSTDGIPATSSATDLAQGDNHDTVGFAGTLTRPNLVLELVYASIAAFVLVLLLLAIFIEIRRQNPVQIAYAMVLLAMMYGLWELHTTLTGGAIIV